MKEVIKKWTKKEFQTYVFIYCMNSDFRETAEELKLIDSKTSNKIYEDMHYEFEKDNDYQSIQKIIASSEKYNYTKEELDTLFNDIKELFLVDGEYVILEKSLLSGLKRLLK
ncbi:hypothetical protein [Tenacibaculum aestuariivivum]|uniref:hypothetical protein n=1 Tax=Tenacibaculum aestuariivivum TaxID=2006131 RepID=UPI003AB8E0FC